MLQSHAVGFLGCVFCYTCLGGIASAKAAEPLVSSARKAWEDYEKVAGKWSYTFHKEYTDLDQGKRSRSSFSATVRSNGRCISIEETSPTDSQARVCRVVNSTYFFNGRLPLGSKGWLLTGVGDDRSMKWAENGAFGRISMREEIQTQSIFAPVSCLNISVRRLIDHPCCKTGRFAQTPEGVEWLFTITEPKQPRGMRRMLGGRILFDTFNHWVIKELNVDGANGHRGITRVRETMAYLPGPDGYPIVKQIKGQLKADDETYEAELQTDFEMISQMKAPGDREFTLTAYGIPESARHTISLTQMAQNEHAGLPRVPSPATAWYWYLMLGAGGLVAAGGIVMALGRLRRALLGANSGTT